MLSPHAVLSKPVARATLPDGRDWDAGRSTVRPKAVVGRPDHPFVQARRAHHAPWIELCAHS